MQGFKLGPKIIRIYIYIYIRVRDVSQDYTTCMNNKTPSSLSATDLQGMRAALLISDTRWGEHYKSLCRCFDLVQLLRDRLINIFTARICTTQVDLRSVNRSLQMVDGFVSTEVTVFTIMM